MPNTNVPAAGEAMPTDLLAATDRYLAAENALNIAVENKEGSPQEAEFYASIASIMDDKLEATSFQGAIKALRLAQAEAASFATGSMVKPLLDGALAYFDSLETRTGVAVRNATVMLQSFNLGGVKGYGWRAVYDALTVVIHSLEGITQQPRCGDGGGFLNAAGEYIEAIVDFAQNERTRLVETLTSARPTTKDDWDARDEILIADRITAMEGDLTDVAKFALSLHAERVEYFGENRP